MKNKILGAVTCIASLVASTAVAAPVTLDFSGVLWGAHTYGTSIPPELDGKAFTGSITVDFNAQPSVRSVEGDTTRVGVAAEYGCSGYFETGECFAVAGSSNPVPVILNVKIDTPVGEYGLALPTDGSAVSQAIYKEELADAGSIVKQTYNLETSHRVSRFLDNGNLDITQKSFTMSFASFEPTLFSDLSDVANLPSLSGRYGTFILNQYAYEHAHCFTCGLDYRWGSYSLTGAITELHFRDDASTDIPEPSSLLLFAGAFAALAFRRRA